MKYRLPEIEDRDILRAYVQEHYDILTPFSVMQDNIIHVSEVVTLRQKWWQTAAIMF